MNKKVILNRISLIVVLIFILSTSLLKISGAVTTVELAVDTAILDQDGVLGIYGGLRFGGEVGLPIGAGDINGDSRADVIFCAMFGDAGPGFRRNNGQASFYLSDGRDSGTVDAAQNPPNIFRLIGANSGDLLGTSVATGDINRDGFRDVAIGASGDDGPANSRFNTGAVYVALGSPDFSLNADLSTPNGVPPPGVIAIYGFSANNRTGIWVDLGDLDGDGFDDIVMGTDQMNRSDAQHTGGACIVFGGPNLPSVIDLASPPAGVRMTALLGVNAEEHWGSALHVGDLNGDGFADIAIAAAIFRDSASYVQPNDFSGHNARAAGFNGQRPGCGEVIVVFGSSNIPRVIDLRTPPPGSTHIIGAKAEDLLGSQVHSADINGDGRRDLIIGALHADAPDNRGRTGAVYVIYGAPSFPGATVDLANPSASGLQVTSIYGETHLDCAGDSVRSFDINRDGLSDLFIGSPAHTFTINGEQRTDAGDTKFIFGRREPLPAEIKLFAPPAGIRIFRLAGAHGAAQGAGGNRGDEFSYRLAGGDVDGDGFVDYISNAMHADGFLNRFNNAGNVYVFSGRKLSERLGMLTPDETPPPALTSATLTNALGQTVQQASAGEAGLVITVDGTGFRSDTEITINGNPVVSHIPEDPQLATTRRVVNLDENPSIRNAAGQLVVRARHISPPSNDSNELNAGRLIGPEITSVKPKKKATGVSLLKINGTGFQQGMTVRVTNAGGQEIPVRSVSFKSSESLQAKISASNSPAPGTLLRVKVVSSTGIESNEVVVTAR
jgi:hypothetical protein